MGNRQIRISLNRIKTYLKRFWWLLIGLTMVGIIAFLVGVNSNKKTMSMVQEIYTYQKILLFNTDENSATDNYIGDFNIFITADEFKEKIYGNEKGVTVEVTRLANSNCSSIVVTSNKKEKAQNVAERIVEEGKNIFNNVYPQITVSDVTSKESVLENESVQLVQLKDVLFLIGPAMLGLFIIYVLMILDERIYTVKELEDFLDMSVYEYTHKECMSQISEMQNKTVIVGRNLDEIISEKEDVVILSDFLRKKNGLGNPKILIVREKDITVGELEDFMRVMERDTEKQLKVIMLNV